MFPFPNLMVYTFHILSILAVYVIILVTSKIEINILNPLPHRCLLALLQTVQTKTRQLLQELSDLSTLFAYGNMIRYDPTQVDLTSNFFVLCTNLKVYLFDYS